MANLFGKLKDKVKKTFDNFGRRKEYADKNKAAKKYDISLETNFDSNYRLIRDIEKCSLYKRNEKDEPAREFIEESTEHIGAKTIVPGQLILFKYLEPKTKDELEYYDALPCTIFFSIVNTKNGKRILGFNIHYFPPKIRFRIMDAIMKNYKAVYSKHFTQVFKKPIQGFDYRTLMKMIENVGLAFGVREYIPELCKDVIPVPANMWKVAAFTEGKFMKRTREAIMNYWKQFQKAEGGPKDRQRAANKAVAKKAAKKNKTQKSYRRPTHS